MTYKEILALSREELEEKLKEEKIFLKKLKFSHKTVRLENPARITFTRKLIAKLLTAKNLLKNKSQING